MRIFKTKTPPVKVEKEEIKKPQHKSAFFFVDRYYRQKEFEEMLEKDIDAKAFFGDSKF
ncbi:MAG: hypothetical protein ACKKMS_02480 [Candidatus Nealsonbacteria bacterium]